jgi:hypothetical protein
MNAAFYAVIGALGGGLITAITTAAVSYYQRTSAMSDAHKVRAFERHLAYYERIFVTVRSVLDSLNDYESVDRRVKNRADPVLQQLLDILSDCSYQYCAAVDWRHNPGMAYLDTKLEETCLHLRDLLLQWLSGNRVSYGDVITIRRNGTVEELSARQVTGLKVGDYEELQIERKIIVVHAQGDARLLHNIRSYSISIINQLKGVLAH